MADKAFYYSNYSHRSIYDIYKLDCKNSLTINNIKKDIFKQHFFVTIAKFKIFDLQITSSSWSLYQNTFLRFLTISLFKILTIIEKYSNNNSTIVKQRT